ncbi:MAG: MBOAT family O-acyltransferase [Candidatus Promineifilaceae bacterium]
MLFNSLEFAFFLPVVFFIYWFVAHNTIRKQNLWLLIASYLFYGWWDWRFLLLLAFSSTVDYFVGHKLALTANQSDRNRLLGLSLASNLGLLGIFKYFNFFSESFASAFTLFGNAPSNPLLLNIILPVGISFYSFQTLSYTIDIYRKKLQPTRDPIIFFAFVSFFPQLVAGPIERAANLLPQFQNGRTFDYHKATDGMRQILLGLFKKMVIADNCAVYVNEIFANYATHTGSTLFLGAFLFAFQIYGDFSGYSDIAIGTARLFGFDLMKNFAFPYFSRDIAEFWRRWHISLSTWFRDYLYIPLGGSRGGLGSKIRNTFIIFVVSGLWHGANWTFVAWGALNALYFLPLLLTKRHRRNLISSPNSRRVPSLHEFFQIITTFTLTLFAWIFFRAPTLKDALQYTAQIFSTSLFSVPEAAPLQTLALIAILIVVEWLQQHQTHAFSVEGIVLPKGVRWSLYLIVSWSILFFGQTQQEFIYFQF